MARDLTSGISTELAKQTLRPVFFVELQIVEGSPPATSYLRMWSGVGDKEWDSTGASPPAPQTWLGAGNLGSISPLTETSDGRAVGVRLTLSGIPASMLQDALTAVRVGLPGKVWFGALDESEAVIADPFLSFSGRVDVVSWALDGQSASISVNVESDLIRLQIPNELRWTHHEQQRLFPGDLGFEFVESLADVQLLWGFATQAPALSSPVATGGGGSLYESFFP